MRSILTSFLKVIKIGPKQIYNKDFEHPISEYYVFVANNLINVSEQREIDVHLFFDFYIIN